jgi:hypothetical protein
MVTKLVRLGRGFSKRMFWGNGSAFFRRIMRQEVLVEYRQRMFGLPDLPVCNAPAFFQVSQKGFNVVKGDGSILLTWKMRLGRIGKCRE